MAAPQLPDIDDYKVREGSHVRLRDLDPRHTAHLDKSMVKAGLPALVARLDELQALFYADGTHKLLVVLQGRDACGKDGTIRSVFEGVNPQGVRVTSFKQPTTVEAAHDYLWRVHAQAPRSGEIMIFNRSHYEDVLVVRVHDLVPKSRWSKRYDHIRAFEQMLADEGTTIVKFYLNVSKDEQRKRLQERVDDPKKRWKFSMADLDERKLWDKYTDAYQDMLERTSTAQNPWYVVPADHNWFRDLVVLGVLITTLEKMNLSYPEPEKGVIGTVVE